MIIFYQQCFCCPKITREKIFTRYFFWACTVLLTPSICVCDPLFSEKNDNKEKVAYGQVSILKDFTEH